MKLVKQSVEFLTPEIYSLEEAYKVAEIAGRTAYKSEKAITKDSAKTFVDAMIKNNHGAVLEHATIYLMIPMNRQDEHQMALYFSSRNFYEYNKYSWCQEDEYSNILYITTNLRVIIENGRQWELEYISCPRAMHVKRYTVKLTTNRQVQNEFVRHRTGSFLVESTRYCDYGKEKFNRELTFIDPKFVSGEAEYKAILRTFEFIEGLYKDLDCIAQEKAQILPLGLKTEMVITMDEEGWKHFFDLRLFGTTGKPHPQAQEAARMISEEFEKHNINLTSLPDCDD